MSSRRRLRHVLVGTLSLGLALSSLTGFSAGASANSDPRFRAATAPETFYPLVGSRSVLDKKSWTRARGFTDIKAPCGSPVRATHAGTVKVLSRKVGRTPVKVVRVHTGPDKLWSGSAYLTRASVTTGQSVVPGKRLGVIGKIGKAKSCKLQFKVATGSRTTDASIWLDRYVGTRFTSTAPVTTPPPPPPPPAIPTPPAASPDSDFNVASFNILGATHTAGGKRPGYATYPSRFRDTMTLFDQREVDVVGLQELHGPQADFMVSEKYTDTWGRFFYDPPGPARDPQNALIWRKSAMDFVRGETFAIPYFYGKPKQMPAVLLRERATGRTAWFLNVHNPASGGSRGDHTVHRDRAMAIERQKVIDYRATGQPVFLVGDFNENDRAVCAFVQDRLMVTPTTQPVDSCDDLRRTRSMPGGSIDWVFGSSQVRFSAFMRDLTPRDTKISDHPLVLGTAHLPD